MTVLNLIFAFLAGALTMKALVNFVESIKSWEWTAFCALTFAALALLHRA
ncbi:MAG TPA: hypothetical protein VD994_19935 [Prosthecobacter sp.]|nr:hypothetical protein [Prosthecobacter sp.]